MDQYQREEELKKFEEHAKLRQAQIKKRMNLYFLALEKSLFNKSRIPLPDEAEGRES